MAGGKEDWRAGLAAYAANPVASLGRRFAEPASPTRSLFQRDCDRIVHATAFRRLKDKTQVFLTGESDHYRTRLTHTLEVSRIARTLARLLGLEEDLAEAVALAHDLGHPPFGHAGERALDRAMKSFGGFDHNRQTLRIVAFLERRYPGFDGINLSFEVLEGLAKHNGPTNSAGPEPWPGILPPPPPEAFASAEAQIAAIADDIAYNAHDIDDGLRLGLIKFEDLEEIGTLAELLAEISAQYPGLEPSRLAAELCRRLITILVEDVGGESARRLAALCPASLADIRRAREPVIAFSPAIAGLNGRIKGFLSARVYRHPRVAHAMDEVGGLVERLYERYFSDQSSLPIEWRSRAGVDEAARARRVADFLAGQTDRYALAEAARLFDASLKSV